MATAVSAQTSNPVTQTITGANSSLAVVTNSAATNGAVAVNIAGTFSATLVFEASADGSNWFTVAGFPILGSGLIGSAVSSVTSAGQFIVPAYGYTQVRVRLSAYTSGNPAISMDTSASAPVGQIFSNTEGLKASYTACAVALAGASSATDLAILPGSATKTIRVTRVIASCSFATAAAYIDIQLIKRSTANSGGTSSAMTIVPLDANDAAATSAPLSYTANPTTGSAVGTVACARYFAALTGTAALLSPPVVFDFGIRPSRAVVLRGTAQGLAVGLGGGPANASTWDITFEWTEE